MHFVKSALTATASDEKLGNLLGMTKKFCFPRKLNITGWLGKSENEAGILYTLGKKALFAVSKKICLRAIVAKSFYIISLHFTWHSMASTLPICFLRSYS